MHDMTGTRPDIAYDVCRLSWYTSNPSKDHWHAVQRILKYLKRTINYTLLYSGEPSVLEGYINASWISYTEDHASTSGWIFTLSGGAISWGSKKQTCITDSTMAAEFVALAAASKEAECIFWLKLRDLSKNLIQRLKKDCRCCWILTSLHSKYIFWSNRRPIGTLSIALESRHPGLSSNI
ncbi:hypothetical protein AAHE18_14G122700 [Arachis hypogaea]